MIILSFITRYFFLLKKSLTWPLFLLWRLEVLVSLVPMVVAMVVMPVPAATRVVVARATALAGHVDANIDVAVAWNISKLIDINFHKTNCSSID